MAVIDLNRWLPLGERRYPKPVEAPLNEAERVQQYRKEVQETAFAYYALALATKLALADGAMNVKEQEACREIFPSNSAVPAETLFKEVAQDRHNHTHYAQKILGLEINTMAKRKVLLQQLIRLAQSDGPMNADEVVFLAELRELLELSDAFFLRLMRHYMMPPKRSPYELLGVARNAPLTLIKEKYYAAVKACHPDNVSFKQASEDIVELANHRLAMLSDAYTEILRQRKLRRRMPA